MSEYQYYEFQTVDRPLDRDAQRALRAISSRARISATSFTNHYEWGDFKGEPRELMERWFDLHLYLANWGSRRLMMRLPARLLGRTDIKHFIRDVDWVEVWHSGDNLIVDMNQSEAEPDDDWDDRVGRLAELAPLRADVLSGDFRIFYLLWLTAVQDELVEDDVVEPLPGIGPLTGALEAFAEFFSIDGDLLEAAADVRAGDMAPSTSDLRDMLETISERDKTELLLRVAQGDAHVSAELRHRVRKTVAGRSMPHRTVRALRARAQEIRDAREQAAAKRRDAEQQRQAKEAEKARRARLDALGRRGEGVWREVEDEIERRNASGYDRAASLLSDLRALAAEKGNEGDFKRRLASIHRRHEKKGKFIERLVGLEAGDDAGAS